MLPKLPSTEHVPLIVVGRGKTLRLKNVKVRTGADGDRVKVMVQAEEGGKRRHRAFDGCAALKAAGRTLNQISFRRTKPATFLLRHTLLSRPPLHPPRFVQVVNRAGLAACLSLGPGARLVAEASDGVTMVEDESELKLGRQHSK